MARLRRSRTDQPGLTRRRRGRGFELLTADGRTVRDAQVTERVAALAIPPAWEEVWICPYPNGHVQATGLDARGRRQYLYHPAWREKREREKFDAATCFGRRLPRLRDRVDEDLRAEGFPIQRVAALGVRLIDRGFFRAGGAEYAEEHGSHGVATLLREHVLVRDGVMIFDFPAKSQQRWVQRIDDPETAAILMRLRRRRGGGDDLLAYKDARGRWQSLLAADLNAYIKESAGEDFTAKCFRTWHATVLAAVWLGAAQPATTDTARRRAKAGAVRAVAELIGNTPAVCRSSYVDPRLLDLYDEGRTIGRRLARRAAIWFDAPEQRDPKLVASAERALLRLLAS